VLLLSKLRAGGHLYYLEAASGPGGKGHEPPGRWTGSGAQRMALGGVVEPDALAALLRGDDPRTGRPLGADRRLVTVAGFDLTFCAPKSVSLLHALGSEEVRGAVEVGHHRAVEAALGYVEGHALAVRRLVPGVRRPVPVPTQAFPAATFVHHVSRALDPHLHSHVLLANVGVGPDGDASALDGRGVYAHRATAGALYHAQLRHELTSALGVAWEPLERGRADVAGIGVQARREFSRRAAAIAADLEARGLASGTGAPSPAAVALARAITRPPKDPSASPDQLRLAWRERARAVGLGPRRLEAVLGRVASRQRAAVEDGAERDRSERDVVDALADHHPPALPFARRHVVRAWASSRPFGEPVAEIERRVDEFLDTAGLPYASGDDRSAHPGPGVAERRRVLPGRLLADDLALGGQQRSVARDRSRQAARGMELDGW
jgi:conjugative relaxase-like TrwC/TraI family protein